MFQVFESVVDVWIIWFVSLFLFGFCIRRAFQQFSWQSFRRFAKSEHGASYALPYVLTFPIFLLLMCVLIQASFIIMCKMGTVYAAHSSARTFVVWQGMNAQAAQAIGLENEEYIRYKTHRAAMMAMAPFANSNVNQRESLFPLFPLALGDGESVEMGALDLPETLANALSFADREAYVQAYSRLVADAHSKDESTTHPIIDRADRIASGNYIRSKYSYAAAATRVTTPEEIAKWNEDVEIKVRYRMAFHLPVTARVFGGESRFWSSQLFRDIETTIVMPSEAADTDDGTIGIPYNIFLF